MECTCAKYINTGMPVKGSNGLAICDGPVDYEVSSRPYFKIPYPVCRNHLHAYYLAEKKYPGTWYMRKMV